MGACCWIVAYLNHVRHGAFLSDGKVQNIEMSASNLTVQLSFLEMRR